MLFSTSSRFVQITAKIAALIFCSVFVCTIWGLFTYRPSNQMDKTLKPGEDLKCYRAIIERIQAGEGYYEAAGSQLRSRGYPTRSIFNWRLPLLAWLLGQLPNIKPGRLLAFALALASVILWIRTVKKEWPFPPVLIYGSLLSGPIIFSLIPNVFTAHEFWAGTLISFSLITGANGWRSVSVVCGILALFIRELSLPFVCVMLIGAYVEGHRRETIAWIIGIVSFGIMFSAHAFYVSSLISGEGLVSYKSWLAFGGLSFVLSTAHMNPFLIAFPPWVTAVVFPFALLGLAGWRGPLGSRVAATVGIYVVSFLFVGQDFNRYWGAMYFFIMPIGIMFVFGSLRDLWQSIRNTHLLPK